MINFSPTRTSRDLLCLLRLIFFNSLIITLFCGCFGAQYEHSDGIVRVVKVRDGDTLDVIHRSEKVKLRLCGIDAPEFGQPLGREAQKHLKSIALGKRFSLRICSKRDRYGRIVGFLTDGESADTVNAQMVRSGYAWWYRRYQPSAYDLRDGEREARKKRLGVWSSNDPTPPWEWREKKRRRTSSR